MKKLFFITLISLCLCTISAQCQSPQPTSQPGALAEEENASRVIEISQDDFVKKVFDYKKEGAVYTGDKPVLVDFYANWCGPCKMLSPIIDELSSTYKNQVVFYKVNVDKAQDLSRALKIGSIPTLLFIKPNTPAERSVGYLEKSDLVKIIDVYLLGHSSQEGE